VSIIFFIRTLYNRWVYSLEGLLQENGPFLWQWGTAHPVPNPYAWNTLANVLWVEQPVGTGFSQGTVNIHDENELA
jgi:carboxypeptidase D